MRALTEPDAPTLDELRQLTNAQLVSLTVAMTQMGTVPATGYSMRAAESAGTTKVRLIQLPAANSACTGSVDPGSDIGPIKDVRAI